MADLLEPQSVTIKTLAGSDKTFVISKFPAIAGREIVAGYPITAVPKIGDYKANEAVMLQLMTYVAVELSGGNQVRLATKELVNNHVPDWETLGKIEIAMMRYNTSFLDQENLSRFSSALMQRAIASISPTLIPLLQQLSAAIKRR